ncbi:MAG: B12-binding domain-containing radical SAM protein [Desulfobulbaceae bacterium]|nr:B12-binding domain-containing radical SAM protein [Desulfobulbaceae bacterium]
MVRRYQLIGLNCRYSHSGLALFYVRHALEHHLPAAKVGMDLFTINDPYYDTLLRISSSKADALFFSVYIWNAQYVSRLVHDLAAIDPDRPIILGGPQAPFAGELPPCCTLAQGEVEGLPAGFYRDLDQGVLQPVYRAEPGHPFPFPYRDEDFTTLLPNRLVYYESSRGCPFRCSYCLSSVGRKVGHKDVETVRQELARILSHEPRIIKFVDRTFNDNPERALEIWRFLAEQHGRTRFHFEIAPDRFTGEMFDLLEKVGPDRFQFEIGMQSTNPETLDAVNRRMDVDIAAENISRLVRLDTIHLHVDLILGLPYETGESFRESFNRVFFLAPHYIQMGLLKVLPETPIRREAEEHGLVFCRQPPYEILANRWLDHRSLARLHLLCECVEAFYNNRWFRTLWKYINRGGEEPYSFFAGLLAVCEEHRFFDLSHTQELLARMLRTLAGQRSDQDLLVNLLRYDWLRCGHRFLPPFLEDKPLAETRAMLRRDLPPSLEGLYDSRGRSEFFKRGVFLELSAEAVDYAEPGRGDRPALACFLPEQTTGVIKHSRVVLLEARP